MRKLDGRSHDRITIDREAYLDALWEVISLTEQMLAENALALRALESGEDCLPHLRAVDRLADRLLEHSRRIAAEASGITYISRHQLYIWEDPSVGRWVLSPEARLAA